MKSSNPHQVVIGVLDSSVYLRLSPPTTSCQKTKLQMEISVSCMNFFNYFHFSAIQKQYNSSRLPMLQPDNNS